jgi:hypothetical protein
MYRGKQGLCLLVRKPQLALSGPSEGAWLPVTMFEPSPYQTILWGLINIPPAAAVARNFIRQYPQVIADTVLRTDRRVEILTALRKRSLPADTRGLLIGRAAWLKQHTAETLLCQAVEHNLPCDVTLPREHFLTWGPWVQSCEKHLALDECFVALRKEVRAGNS